MFLIANTNNRTLDFFGIPAAWPHSSVHRMGCQASQCLCSAVPSYQILSVCTEVIGSMMAKEPLEWYVGPSPHPTSSIAPTLCNRNCTAHLGIGQNPKNYMLVCLPSRSLGLSLDKWPLVLCGRPPLSRDLFLETQAC